MTVTAAHFCSHGRHVCCGLDFGLDCDLDYGFCLDPGYDPGCDLGYGPGCGLDYLYCRRRCALLLFCSLLHHHCYCCYRCGAEE